MRFWVLGEFLRNLLLGAIDWSWRVYIDLGREKSFFYQNFEHLIRCKRSPIEWKPVIFKKSKEKALPPVTPNRSSKVIYLVLQLPSKESTPIISVEKISTFTEKNLTENFTFRKNRWTKERLHLPINLCVSAF